MYRRLKGQMLVLGLVLTSVLLLSSIISIYYLVNTLNVNVSFELGVQEKCSLLREAIAYASVKSTNIQEFKKFVTEWLIMTVNKSGLAGKPTLDKTILDSLEVSYLIGVNGTYYAGIGDAYYRVSWTIKKENVFIDITGEPYVRLKIYYVHERIGVKVWPRHLEAYAGSKRLYVAHNLNYTYIIYMPMYYSKIILRDDFGVHVRINISEVLVPLDQS